MDFSDDEISMDPTHQTNKVACETESTLDKLAGPGLNTREMMLFEGRLKGTRTNHNFFQIWFLEIFSRFQLGQYSYPSLNCSSLYIFGPFIYVL